MAGRASGIVMLGFLGGLTAGSPVAGAVIDAVGSYQPVWAGSAALLLASALVALPRFTGGTR
jgi:predicted MFS family arabinose efflux permease